MRRCSQRPRNPEPSRHKQSESAARKSYSAAICSLQGALRNSPSAESAMGTPPPAIQILPQSGINGPDSVSYTHLRAHETSAHL
eukprot:7360069-Alexandrium_andersonii.AAC.1